MTRGWELHRSARGVDQAPYDTSVGDLVAGLLALVGPPRPTTLDGDASVGVLVASALRGSVATLLAQDPEIRAGADPEGVHRARVATRRLRSDLRTFEPVLELRWSGRVRDEVAWFADSLGPVRDADVLLDALSASALSLPSRDVATATRLIDRLRVRREDVRTELLVGMGSDRYLTMLDDLVAAALAPAVLPDAEGRRARSLGVLMGRPWKQLRHAAAAAERRPSDPELHRLRIRAKRARYASEALAPVFGKPARRFAESAADLQTVLGRQHDAVVAAAWLRDEGVRAEPLMAFVAGEFSELQRTIADGGREEWREPWVRLDRRSMRFWK